MKSLTKNPQKIFCGVLQGGAYVSENRAESWQLIENIGENNPIYDLSILANGTVYFASKFGLFLSRDSGCSWKKILSTHTWQVKALKDGIVAVDTAANKGYRRPIGQYWLLSYDYGQNWQNWEGTLDSSKLVYSYLILNQNKRGNMILHNDGLVYRTENTRIYRTDGNNWNKWVELTSVDSLNFFPAFVFLFKPVNDVSTLFAYAEYMDYHPGGWFDGGIFKSVDNSQSWERITNINSVTALSTKDSLLFIGETGGNLYSYHFTDAEPEYLGAFGANITSIDPENWAIGELIIATDNGIYKSNDLGKSWMKSDFGIQHISAVAVQTIPLGTDEERIVIAVKNGGILLTDDLKKWQQFDRTTYILPALMKQAPNLQYFLCGGGSVLKTSNDGGKLWDKIPNYEFPAGYYGWYGRVVDIAINPKDKNNIIVHYFDHSMDHYVGVVCAETFNGGRTWISRNQFDDQENYSLRAVFDSTYNRLWFSKRERYQASPGLMAIDTTWEDSVKYFTLPHSVPADYFHVEGDTIYVINSGNAKFMRSYDLGENWWVNDLGDFNYSNYWDDWAAWQDFGQLVLSPDKQNLVFVYPGTGVFYSHDEGDNWTKINDGLPTLKTYHLTFSKVNPSIAYLATDNGFYKRDLTTNVCWENDKPANNLKTYLLCYNYPNPFNSSTTIRYQLPEKSDVKITIHNILGQHVITLVDEEKVAGNFSLKWDAANQSGKKVGSGLYFMSFTAQTDSRIFNKTNKLLLLE